MRNLHLALVKLSNEGIISIEELPIGDLCSLFITTISKSKAAQNL